MAVRNVFGDLALDTTLQAVRDRLGSILTALGSTLSVHVENPTADPETGLAKDTTLQDVLAEVAASAAQVAATTAVQVSADQMAMLLQRMSDLHDPVRVLPYAKDSSEAMRVAASGTVSTGTTQIWNFGGYVLWYASSGSPNSMDPREQQKLISEQNFNQVRQGRWSVT